MITVQEVDEHTATVPVANSGEVCSHGERLATAQALANRTNRANKILTAAQGASGTELVAANQPIGILADMYVPVAGRADQIRNIGLRVQNLINWVRNRVTGAGSILTPMRWAPAPVALVEANWGFSPGTSAFYIHQVALSSSPVILTVPHVHPGLFVSGLRLTVSSPIAHAGLPAIMPAVYLLNQGAGTASTIASAIDSSASVGAYEGVHDITVTFKYQVTNDDCLVLAVVGESGANGQASSFRIFRARMDVSYE